MGFKDWEKSTKWIAGVFAAAVVLAIIATAIMIY